jgi:hypothetical protein
VSDAIHPELYAKVNARLDAMIASFYDAAPAARYLATSASIEPQLYIRHTIETILRIRLARVADSKVIQHFTKTDPFAAEKWAKYTQEEMLHDRLFLKDLKSLGVTEEQVYATDPLLATKLLQGYLYYTIEHEGPRGLLCKSYFVEYTTRKTQAIWNRNVKRALGEKAVKGAEAHLSYDVDEDHSTDVWNVLMTVVKTPEDEARTLAHLEVYYGLFVAYFNELASVTQRDLAVPGLDAASAAVWGAQRAGQPGVAGHREA